MPNQSVDKSQQLTSDLIAVIFNVGQMLREKVKEKTSSQDCSFLHVQTLHYIKDRKETAMKNMAHYLHITPPSATSLVNLLVKQGAVKRIADKNDRRTIKLQITGEGINLLKNNFKKAATIMEKSLEKLSIKEKKNFITILKKISQ